MASLGQSVEVHTYLDPSTGLVTIGLGDGLFANPTGFNNPIGAPPTGAAGGGLAGTYPNPTIAALPLVVGGVTTKQLISRFVNSAALNVTNSASGTYVDFGGSFTTAVTVLAADQVVVRIQSIVKKAVGGAGSIVVDRGGAKLPATGISSSLYFEFAASAGFLPFMLEVVDTPGAGTFTYKPQLFTSDANTATAGGGIFCGFVVEVWR